MSASLQDFTNINNDEKQNKLNEYYDYLLFKNVNLNYDELIKKIKGENNNVKSSSLK